MHVFARLSCVCMHSQGCHESGMYAFACDGTLATVKTSLPRPTAQANEIAILLRRYV